MLNDVNLKCSTTSTKDKGTYHCGRECGKIYHYYSSLQKHLKNHHKGNPPDGIFKTKNVGR